MDWPIPPPEIGRQGQPEPEGGNRGPREASSTKLQAGFIANQDFLGFWMVDIHWEGCSQRSAPQKRHMAHLRRCAGCTPRKLSSRDGGDGKLQPSIGGDHTRQAPGHMSCSDLGRAQNSTQTSQSLCGVPEYLNLSGLDLGSAYNTGPASERSWQSNLEPKQCRQGKHTYHEPGQTQCG